MTTLAMNEKLINTLSLMEAKKSLCIAESVAGLTQNWDKDLEVYFKNLPDEMVQGVGLKKSRQCFEAVERFTITEEMNKTEYSELGKFSFSYPGQD